MAFEHGGAMSRRRSAAAVAAVIMSMAAVGSALAAPPPGTLDQKHECATTDCNTADTADYPNWYSQNGTGNNDATAQETLGQTFTAGMTGHLRGVSLYLAGIDGGTVPASLAVAIVNLDGAGKPNLGSVLASGTIPTAGTSISSSTTPDWFSVVFASPPTVTSGHKYAIVLAPATWTQAGGAWMRWGIDSTNAGAYTDYAGGEAMAATRPQSSAAWSWETMNDVLTDGSPGTADFGFRTYVEAAANPTPFVPTQPPTDAAPAGRGGSSSSGAMPVLLALGSLAAVALLATRRRGAVRRR